MCPQALSLPMDISWQRLAYSRDMMDTNSADFDLPPKWRSSMAIYSYLVPEDQTAMQYPDGRIVYLRMTCSITGWNPSEDLLNAVNLAEVGDSLDDLQTSIWDAIQSDGWASAYWPCLGAIAQIAIYPSAQDGDISADSYPYIVDFEPKKRELLETRSETGEFVSGSSNKVGVQKGTTTTDSTEQTSIKSVSAGGGFGFGPISANASASAEWGTKNNSGTESVDVTNTDSSREKRESTSFTTTINQMYQLFNGYHLGMNRAVFYIEPRPHIVEQTAQTSSNLIRGQRKLEGLQDMFIVVYVPKELKGICVQANLDTTHRAMFTNGVAYAMRIDDETTPPPTLGGKRPPWDHLEDFPIDIAPETVTYRLVMTRRTVRNCAAFDSAKERLVPTGASSAPVPSSMTRVVFETSVPGPAQSHEANLFRGGEKRLEARTSLADQMNKFQSEVTHAMLAGFSSGRYKPKPFHETDTFRQLAGITLKQTDIKIEGLADSNRLSADEVQKLKDSNVHSLSDLFDEAKGQKLDRVLGDKVRKVVREAMLDATKRPQR
jgi:hypothetical protein